MTEITSSELPSLSVHIFEKSDKIKITYPISGELWPRKVVNHKKIIKNNNKKIIIKKK